MSALRTSIRWQRAILLVLGLILLLAVAATINLIGIQLAGDVGRWLTWMDRHANYLLAWRLLLYTGTAWGWVWMRRRLLAREPGEVTRARLARVEVASMLAILALEVSQRWRG